MTTELLQNEIIGIDELDDEKLGQVAGGNSDETAKDSRFLNSLGRFTNRYGIFRIKVEDHDAEIRHGWARVGVDVEIHSGNFFDGGDWNVYRINGEEVCREDAIDHAMKVTGHYMKWGSWNW